VPNIIRRNSGHYDEHFRQPASNSPPYRRRRPRLRSRPGRHSSAGGEQDQAGCGHHRRACRRRLEEAGLALDWHFIGPLQSNKTRQVATWFDWVHSVDREKIAVRLSEQRDPHRPPLNLCIQVNVSGEASKSGVAPDEVAALADAIAALPRLALRGLMAIPEPTDDVALQRRRFAHLRQLKDDLNARGHRLDTLSMGMSQDLEAAIAEGATIVRIGTALFGARG
jgi:PLP dependent protein